MRKYRRDASSEVRLAYGMELGMALEMEEALTPLFEAMADAQATLEAAFGARRTLEVRRTRARVTLRFVERRLEVAVRNLHRRAGIADGGRVGPVTNALFPDGLVAETAPVGERQERRARALLERLESLQGAQGELPRAEGLRELGPAVAAYLAARAESEAASDAVAQAFARELRARDAHRLQVDRVMGQLVALFPDDPVRRSLYFPDLDDRVTPREPAAPDVSP